MTREPTEQLLACAMLMRAKKSGEKGVLRGDFEVVLDGVYAECSDDNTDANWIFGKFKDSANILQEIGVLSRTIIADGMEFYKISYVDFNSFISTVEKDRQKFNKMVAMDPFLEGKAQPSRSIILANKYKIFQKYFEFGDDWLRRSLLLVPKYAEGVIDADNSIVRRSVRNAGAVSVVRLDLEGCAAAVRELDRIEVQISKSDLTQEVRAQARAYIIAARALLEAPEPEVDMAWEIINRANNLAGIASFFVSLISLFISVAH